MKLIPLFEMKPDDGTDATTRKYVSKSSGGLTPGQKMMLYDKEDDPSLKIGDKVHILETPGCSGIFTIKKLEKGMAWFDETDKSVSQWLLSPAKRKK